jgi:hypothetical protein
MRRFVAALLRQSARIVPCRRGKERGESERNLMYMCVCKNC